MLLQHIFEAPIEDFNLVGDWSKGSSFRHPQDRKLLTNPKAQDKIIHKWSKTTVAFNMYFINNAEARKHTEVGEVSEAWLQQNMPATLPQLRIRDDAVNVLFTNNSGAERAPMTAWIIAHRLGHAVRNLDHSWSSVRQGPWWEIANGIERSLTDILTSAYGLRAPTRYDTTRRDFEAILCRFAEKIGTFRSARENNIRDFGEFYHELLAQYITTGTVRFAPAPSSFGYGRMAWGRATHNAYSRDTSDANDSLTDLAARLEWQFEELLERCVGRIFVM